jgi:hypothetical protein
VVNADFSMSAETFHDPPSNPSLGAPNEREVCKFGLENNDPWSSIPSHGNPSTICVCIYIYIICIMLCIYIYYVIDIYIYVLSLWKWSDDHLLHWKINHVLTMAHMEFVWTCCLHFYTICLKNCDANLLKAPPNQNRCEQNPKKNGVSVSPFLHL